MPNPPRRRKDAEANRARIVAAARALFASRGRDVPLDAIAREAGVGNATVYRHFPTWEALFAAIQEASLSETAAFLDGMADDLDEWGRLAALVQWIADRPDVTLVDTIFAPDLYDSDLGRRARELEDRAWQLVQAAQDAGAVRALSRTEMDAIFLAVARVATEPGVSVESTQTFVDIVLEGIRARTLSGD
ncbi:TetR/AcrR family transcriptional regulator [Microbacterium sediminicola]|uniref:TetR/AcrR family transcriptional regulator n=1 Tax=Microbacterium sediminicola TaxID=415210 RepID=A0ABP4UH11_9MICO